jgi:hypothetical protein
VKRWELSVQEREPSLFGRQESLMILAEIMSAPATVTSESWPMRVFHKIPFLSGGPTSIFSPQATPAHAIFGVSIFVLAITLSIFLVVAGLLAYTLVRFRHRGGDSATEPTQVYGSQQIEVLWTALPILIVLVLFLATARIINVTERARKPANALDVVVIAHQFWWEYRYPALGIVTANELHIPASDAAAPTPTYLTMTSADVDHSFCECDVDRPLAARSLSGPMRAVLRHGPRHDADPGLCGHAWAVCAVGGQPEAGGSRCCLRRRR